LLSKFETDNQSGSLYETLSEAKTLLERYDKSLEQSPQTPFSRKRKSGDKEEDPNTTTKKRKNSLRD
jgi:hypothetical protein